MAEREFDVVVLGATGFTGRLTAEYLLEHADAGVRLGIAGRSREKLMGVAGAGSRFGVIEVDVSDPASVAAMVSRTRVLITTVGPYLAYGEPVVAACAAAGTDYVDLTGEPEFVDRMYLKYNDAAIASGARLVHSCGFDSIPYDLGVLWTVAQLGTVDKPLSVSCFVKAKGTFSGGTYHSAIGAVGRLRQSTAAARERGRAEKAAVPLASGRSVKVATRPPRHDSTAGGWIVPFPSIDPQTVLRSARRLDSYGPAFTYEHTVVVGKPWMAAGAIVGAAGFVATASLPPGRSLLRRLKAPGEGPTAEQRERSWFRIRFRAETGGRTLVTEVSGGDPGYGETAKMLAESALCLAGDSLPKLSGQLTPAVAMGDALIQRLIRAGISFAVLEGTPAADQAVAAAG